MEAYRKIEMKGKGSYGQAILVQNIRDRKFYIMKIINASMLDIKEKENALHEIDVLKSLNHPYIIQYRESFIDKKKYLCIVMDYAEEGTLEQTIQQHKQTSTFIKEQKIIEWFTQICLAIKYIHDRKIIHRDIKTQNIFISKGEIKLGDFGIAKTLIKTDDMCQTIIGTPYYISPEVCQRIPYDFKSDIWSLGCILYEMMALKHAFEAKTIESLFLKVISGKYQPVPNFYSSELHQLLKDILNTDPNLRPTINEILENNLIKKTKLQYLNLQQKIDQQFCGESLADQIERMRMELEETLGIDNFINIYNQLKYNEKINTIRNKEIIKAIQNLIELEQLIF